MSQTAALLLLFIVLPLVVAPIVIAFVARRSPALPPGFRTSELLLDGEPAEAELLAWKNKGPFLFDSRPMVEFKLAVRTDAGERIDLVIVQSFPRAVLSQLAEGMTLDIRLSADHTAGAIVPPSTGA